MNLEEYHQWSLSHYLKKSGLIIPVGKWVLEKSNSSMFIIKKYQSQLKVNVNISYVQVLKSAILNDILSIMKKYNVDQID